MTSSWPCPKGMRRPWARGEYRFPAGNGNAFQLARAMLKDAPVIILDEATASVDPENERQLQEAFEALTATRLSS